MNKTIKLTLEWIDWNAFAIMGVFSKQAKKEWRTKAEIDDVIKEATSWDYNHLIETISWYCDC